MINLCSVWTHLIFFFEFLRAFDFAAFWIRNIRMWFLFSVMNSILGLVLYNKIDDAKRK